jgi:hypothetical protein
MRGLSRQLTIRCCSPGRWQGQGNDRETIRTLWWLSGLPKAILQYMLDMSSVSLFKNRTISGRYMVFGSWYLVSMSFVTYPRAGPPREPILSCSFLTPIILGLHGLVQFELHDSEPEAPRCLRSRVNPIESESTPEFSAHATCLMLRTV